MFMKRLLFAVTIALLVGSGAGFQVSDLQNGDLGQYESVINNQTDNAPPFLSGLVGNQTVNMNMENSDGTDVTAGAKIEGLVVTEMQAEGYENATIEITTDQETVSTIAESNNPVGTAITEFNDGDIEYEAEGFWNKLKLSIAEALM